MKTAFWGAAVAAGVVLGLGLRMYFAGPIDYAMSPEDWYFFR